VSEAADRHARLAIMGGLLLLTAVAFEGVRRCDFVAFDDNIYVYGHPYVVRGLTWEGIRWAFAADLLFESPHADYWMPLTIVSRMLDVQLFGLDPGTHHLANAAIHAFAVLVVFLMLEGLTGARWASAFAAAVFAVHPLAVESVAWVSERKNVLSGLFWMLAVFCYGRQARRGDRRSYAAALAMMALGLLCKPTAVTLPLVFLALDVWPLARFRRDGASAARLLVEKVPFLALSAASSAVTLLALSRGAHLTSMDTVALPSRIANALRALVLYAGQVVWPTRLAVLYPHPGADFLGWRTGLAAVVIAAIGGVVFRHARRHGYLPTGLAWVVIPLVPVLGLIQSGQQSHADRFMYIPLVGVGIVLAWGVADAAGSRPAVRRIVPWAATALLATWVILTRAQVAQWRDTVTLFTHALAVTEGNHLAHHNLAAALALRGDLPGARTHDEAAIRIRPGYVEARSSLGVTLAREGRLQDALAQHQEALRLAPASADVHFNLAVVLARLGRTAEAAERYAEAVRLNPALAAAHYNWGNLLASLGRFTEAEARFREAVRLEPANHDAVNNLGLAIGLRGGWAEAAEVLEQLVAHDPGHVRARVNLGRALLELGRPEEARVQWRTVLERYPRDPAAAEASEELARLDSIRAAR
jgi:tetratricopeptide (TPR) repeat protein